MANPAPNKYMERFSFQFDRYCEGCPVVIRRGVLLQDTQDNTVQVRLQFQNITPEPIRGLTVVVFPADGEGNALDDVVTFDYTDLNAERVSGFGMDHVIFVPENSYSFSVIVSEVSFVSGDSWAESIDSEWIDLPIQKDLGAELGSADMLKQYQMEINPKAKFCLSRHGMIWRCSCGAVNSSRDRVCFACGMDALAYENVDRMALAQHCQIRMGNVARQREEQLRQEEEQKKKREQNQKYIKLGLIFAAALVAVFVLLRVVGGHLQHSGGTGNNARNDLYQQGIEALNDKDYDEAIRIFESIPDHPDSEKQIQHAKYDMACDLMDEGNYDQAFKILKDIRGYDQAEARLTECGEILAEAAMAEGNYLQAKRYFIEIGDSDRVDRIEEARVDELRMKSIGNLNALIADREYRSEEQLIIEQYIGEYYDKIGRESDHSKIAAIENEYKEKLNAVMTNADYIRFEQEAAEAAERLEQERIAAEKAAAEQAEAERIAAEKAEKERQAAAKAAQDKAAAEAKAAAEKAAQEQAAAAKAAQDKAAAEAKAAQEQASAQESQDKWLLKKMLFNASGGDTESDQSKFSSGSTVYVHLEFAEKDMRNGKMVVQWPDNYESRASYSTLYNQKKCYCEFRRGGVSGEVYVQVFDDAGTLIAGKKFKYE